MLRTTLKYSGLCVAALFIVAQFVQPDRANPPADASAGFEAVAKPSPQASAVLRRACYDCHSHNTVWPWYSRISPVSWLVADDVKRGRAHLNFSQWNLLSPEMSRTRIKEACQEVTKKNMPLWNYTIMHPEARLTDGDIRNICEAVRQDPVQPY